MQICRPQCCSQVCLKADTPTLMAPAIIHSLSLHRRMFSNTLVWVSEWAFNVKLLFVIVRRDGAMWLMGVLSQWPDQDCAPSRPVSPRKQDCHQIRRLTVSLIVSPAMQEKHRHSRSTPTACQPAHITGSICLVDRDHASFDYCLSCSARHSVLGMQIIHSQAWM